MTIATRLRAIVHASAHIPTAPVEDVRRIGELAAIPALAQAESAKKRLRADAIGRTSDPADPEARAYIILGLLGEAGELASAAIDPGASRATILSEAGDLLWSLDALLAQHGADISDAVDALEAKMMARHADRLAAAGYRPTASV